MEVAAVVSVGANEEAERSHAAADRVHLGLPTQGPDVVNVGRHQSLINAGGQPASTLAYLSKAQTSTWVFISS